MAVVRLRPGPVGQSATGGESPTIVGGGSQWADDSDATYATQGWAGALPGAFTDTPSAPVSALAVWVRYSTNATTEPPEGRIIQARLNGDNGVGGYSWGWVVPADRGIVHEMTAPLDYRDPATVPNWEVVKGLLDEWFTSGSVWCEWRVDPANSHVGVTITVYEMALIVGLGAPPRRTFPRDDGLTGGAPRTYPPSRGLQSGIRTSGGYL